MFARDALDDMRLWGSGAIPGTGARNTRMYQRVAGLLEGHPEIHTLTGHSLGGSIAKQLAKDTGRRYRIYGSPSVTWQDDPNSFRRYGDPISIFDRGAQDAFPATWNPHSYV